MKTLEELYAEAAVSEELKAEFVAAAKENKLGEFLKAQGCEATEAEVAEFLKSKQSAEGEVADEELDAVAGGCNKDEAIMSTISLGVACAIWAETSARSDVPKSEWEDGRIICDAFTGFDFD